MRKRELSPSDRMAESDRFRMKGLMIQIGQEERGLSPSSGWKRHHGPPPSPVFGVPEHGMPEVGEMDANLMGASRLQGELEIG